MRRLADWDPTDENKLEPGVNGNAHRVLLEHGWRLLLAAEDDGSYTWFLRGEGNGIWRAGNEALQSRPPTAELRELITRSNRDYRDYLLKAAWDGDLFGEMKDADKRVAAVAPTLKALDRQATPAAAIDTMRAMAPAVINAELRGTPEEYGVTRCSRADLDANSRYLGASNGVLDLVDGDLLTGAAAAAALVTAQLPDEFDGAAQHDDVARLVAHQTPEAAEWTLDALAYGMRGVTTGEKALNVIIGAPNGGKSTLVEAVQAAFGAYVATLDDGALAPARRGGNATPSMATVMPPTRWAFAPEMKGLWIDPARVNALTGTDSQAWRDLYQSVRKQRPMATIWLVGNEMPKNIADLVEDAATVSRLRIVEYAAIPPEARQPRMLSAFDGAGGKRARQALVAELVRRVLRQGDEPPEMPASVAASSAAQIAAARGEAATWIRAAVEEYEGGVLTTAELWQAALAESGGKDQAWGKDRQQIVALARSIYDLPNVRQIKRAGKQERGWRDVRLVDDDFLDDEPEAAQGQTGELL